MSNNIPTTVSKIYIHTGNMLNLNKLTNVVSLNSTEKVVECLKICLSQKQKSLTFNEKIVNLRYDQCYINDHKEDYIDLKTTVKIFLTSNEVAVLEDSLKYLFKELGEKAIDSVILALDHSKHPLFADLSTLWAVLEKYVNEKKIAHIGVSDIATDMFISLYNNSIIKPTIIQINLNSSHVVAETLQEFSKDNGILVLTHSDGKEIMPQSSLDGFFEDHVGITQLKPELEWMLKYVSHVKHRGILTHEEFIMCFKTT